MFHTFHAHTAKQHSIQSIKTQLCNTLMKHVKHDYETSVTFHVFFIVSVHTMLDSCVTNVWCGNYSSKNLSYT